MFDNARKLVARTLCLLVFTCLAAGAFADIGTLTVTGVYVLVGVPPTLTLDISTNIIIITAAELGTGNHQFNLDAYVSSTNGPETAVVLDIGNFVAGGTYGVSLTNGATPTLQLGGSAPGTQIIHGTSTLLGLSLNLATTGLRVTVPTSAPAGNYTGNVTYSLNLGSGTNPAAVTIPYTYTVPMSVSISPNPLIGTIPATGTITLANPAPAGGIGVTLSSTSSNVTVPSGVLVPAGQTTVTFPITTTEPAASLTATVTASAVFGAFTANATYALQVYGNYITGLTISPNSIVGGASATGTLSLYLPASTSGWTVNLSSQYPSSVKVPASVTVPTGSSSTTFTVTTSPTTVTTTCGIYASDGTSAASFALGTQGDGIIGVSIPATTIGADQTATGTITLQAPAPAAGWTVNLKTEYPSCVSVPASITIPAGSSSGTFTITPKQIPNATLQCDVYVSDALTGRQGTVWIAGDSLKTLAISPGTVVSGMGATGTVTLTEAAPAGGWVVTLSDQYPSVVGIPASVTVPAGSTTATFPITTKKVINTTLPCGIYSFDGHAGANSSITLLGVNYVSIVLAPDEIVGGTSTTGTCTIANPAPAGGWTISLSCEYPSIIKVPATVTVPEGATSVTFTLQVTKTTTVQYVAGVYSYDGVTGRNTTITIDP